MEIRDTREKMNIPPAGIELNEELIIVSKLSEGGSSYTYRAKKKDSEYVILKEYYPLDRAIYIRDKDGFLKYKDSLDESQRAEESRFRDAWMSGELEIANIAFREEKSNSDCSFGHHLVKLESEKTDSAFIEIWTVNGEPLDEWCKVIWARAAGEKEKRKELIEMLQKICSVVESFHKKGIIHCDLKPQNIYITEHKSVFILDFATSIYREKNEIKACGPELGGISEGYSSMSIRDLSTSLDNITRINEADDIYSIIQILFYMLFGKTVEQITDDCSDKNFDELVEELVGSHLEAQHLLLICMLLDDKKRLNMSNIQRCLEDLQHTEAMLADEKTHFLSELVKPGTFHNLRSLLVLIGKITCAVKDSKPYGKRFLLDSRDILVKGSLESDYTVAVASIKAIPGLDGAVPDEKENVRKIRLLLRGFIKNSEDSGKPIRGGINCVGRRKLAKLLDDEHFLNYDEFNNAIEELKNYSDPELTYFETNAEDPIITQSFDLISGDWDRIIGFLRSDGRSNTFHTNNYAAFINQLIERLQADENGIICVLKYDDNIDEMIERIPVTIPYDNGYEVASAVSDNLKIENDDKLYIVIWGISKDEQEIDSLLIGGKRRLNNSKLEKKVKYIYVDDRLSSGGNDFIYKNMDIEEINLNDTISILKCIEKQNLYGISHDSIKYIIENMGKDKSLIDRLICKKYVMLICGQLYISSRIPSELKGKYEQKEWETQSLEMLEKIFHCIVSKSAYNYNDELTMLGILKIFKIMIKFEKTEIESLIKNIRYEFLYNEINEVIINYAYTIYGSETNFCIVEYNINKQSKIEDELRRIEYIERTEVNGCEEELDRICIEAFRKRIPLSYVRTNFADKELILKNSVIDICKNELSKTINSKNKDKKIMLLVDIICRLIFNNYSMTEMLPSHFDDEKCVIKRYTNKLQVYDYKKEKQYNKANFEYLLNNIKVMPDCNDKKPQMRAVLYKIRAYIFITQFKLKENGLIDNSSDNKEHYDLLIRLLEDMYECDIPAIEALRLIYYSWKELNSEKLFHMILLKNLNKFHLINEMLMCITRTPKSATMFLGSSNLKLDFYNYIIDESNYLDYAMDMQIYVMHILMIVPVAHIKDINQMKRLLSAATECRDYIIEQALHKLEEEPDDLLGKKEVIKTNIQDIISDLLNLFNADLAYDIGNYKDALEYYSNIGRTNIWDKIFNLFLIPYINNYKYNIKNMQLYINFKKNECDKVLLMEEIVNIMGTDKFNMDNLDREDFVESGKALVEEIEEINKLVLLEGYDDNDSIIISFMTMYELMQYLYELDDRATYEKYYCLLTNKIKYCREKYRDLIVYDRGKFTRLTEQQMTDYMINIEKYRKKFDED